MLSSVSGNAAGGVTHVGPFPNQDVSLWVGRTRARSSTKRSLTTSCGCAALGGSHTGPFLNQEITHYCGRAALGVFASVGVSLAYVGVFALSHKTRENECAGCEPCLQLQRATPEK
jgi:hypothetical protein